MVESPITAQIPYHSSNICLHHPFLAAFWPGPAPQNLEGLPQELNQSMSLTQSGVGTSHTCNIENSIVKWSCLAYAYFILLQGLIVGLEKAIC